MRSHKVDVPYNFLQEVSRVCASAEQSEPRKRKMQSSGSKGSRLGGSKRIPRLVVKDLLIQGWPRCSWPEQRPVQTEGQWLSGDLSPRRKKLLNIFRHIERRCLLLLECLEVHRKLKVTIINSRENKELYKHENGIIKYCMAWPK